MRRRTLVTSTLPGVILGLSGCSGQSPRASTTMPSFDLTSTAFGDGDSLPTAFSCDANGGGVSPPLTPALPAAASSWAVVVTDPDAPSGTFTHWTIWNLPADRALPRDVPPGESVDSLGGAEQGTTDFGTTGYGAPCPPRGDDAHRYHFDAYALDGSLDVDAGASPDAVQTALDDASVVGSARLTATYARA